MPAARVAEGAGSFYFIPALPADDIIYIALVSGNLALQAAQVLG